MKKDDGIGKERRTYPAKLISFLLGTCVALLLLLLVIFILKRGSFFIPSIVDKELFNNNDQWLGHCFYPNVTVQLRYHKELIIQTTDEFARRATVQPKGDYRSFAIFAPDSMLFGVNVNDDQTVASHFARLTKSEKIRAYNYAVSGYGPNHFLALVTDKRFYEGIKEKRGVVVYSYNDLHIERAACWPFFFTVNPDVLLPRYILDKDSIIRRAGTLTAGDIKLKDDANWVDQAATWLGPYSDSNRRLTARMIGQAKKELEKHFELLGFVVIFLNTSKKADLLTDLLKDEGIYSFDYQGLMYSQCDGEPCLQPENSHPTAKCNLAMAERVIKDLTNLGIMPQ